MRFTWNEAKRKLNIQAHGFDLWTRPRFSMVLPSHTKTTASTIPSNALSLLVCCKGWWYRLFIPSPRDRFALSLSVRRRNMSKLSSSKASRTNWSRVRAMTDRDILVPVEHPEASVKHIVRSIVRRGLKPVPPKASISLRLDADVLEWLKSQGPGYQTRINAILRAFKEASA